MDTADNPVRKARLAGGHDQVSLLHAIRQRGWKISLSTLRLAEQGVATPKTLAVIADALGVDVAALQFPEAKP